MKVTASVAAVVLLLLLSICSSGVQGQHGAQWRNLTHNLRFNISAPTGQMFSFSDNTTLPIAAAVVYNESLMATGWDWLYIEANTELADLTEEEHYYAAGYAEGFITQPKILLNYGNVKQFTADARSDEGVQNWIIGHRDFMKTYSRDHYDQAWGKQLFCLLHQLDGMAQGYMDAAPVGSGATKEDIFNINFHEEWGDVMEAFTSQLDKDALEKFPNLKELYPTGAPRHCSALIRILPDDVFVSHVTWTHYQTMMRQYKTYRFGNVKSVSMSSYPGMIHSMDDWYMTGHKLAVMETTNGVYNNALFKDYLKGNYSVVSEFLRVMIANYLSYDAATWVQNFAKLNSGTYNNQFMAFDMKKFVPGEPLPADTFWIAEQLPGSVTTGDMSSFVNDNAHWPSYNVPYFKSVYNISGNLQREMEFGSFFSYSNYSRAEIFARNYSKVHNMEDMKRMMRFNHFQNDPLSKIPNCSGTPNGVCDPTHSAMLTIASRGDLNPAVGEYGVLEHYVGQRDHGATDAKIASWKNMMQDDKPDIITGVIISGPTSDDQPVFDWNTSPWANDPTVRRNGVPTRFEFPWVTYAVDVAGVINPPMTQPPATPPGNHDGDDDGGDAKTVAIVVGCIGGTLAAVLVIGVLITAKQTKRREVEALLGPEK